MHVEANLKNPDFDYFMTILFLKDFIVRCPVGLHGPTILSYDSSYLNKAIGQI